MKKIIVSLLSLMIFIATLAGCGATSDNTDNSTGNITDVSADNSENSETNSDNTSDTDENISDSELSKDSETEKEPPELSESMMVALTEILGISYEEFSSFDVDKQYAILAELGYVLEDTSEKDSEKNERPVYTTADVTNGGKFKVTIQDSMGWNSYTFYYEDGKLVKIETSFRKNDEEEPENDTYEGASLSENKYSAMTLDEIISDITEDTNNFHIYINKLD